MQPNGNIYTRRQSNFNKVSERLFIIVHQNHNVP